MGQIKQGVARKERALACRSARVPGRDRAPKRVSAPDGQEVQVQRQQPVYDDTGRAAGGDRGIAAGQQLAQAARVHACMPNWNHRLERLHWH